jgi:hypothetical protein
MSSSTEKELTVQQQIDAISVNIGTLGVDEEKLTALEEKYPVAGLPARLEDGSRIKELKAEIKELAPLRIEAGKTADKLKKPLNALRKQIIEADKEIKNRVSALEEPRKSLVNEYNGRVEREAAEAQHAEDMRINEISGRIQAIRDIPGKMISDSAEKVMAEIEELSASIESVPEWCAGKDEELYVKKAKAAVDYAIDGLKDIHSMKVAAEQAEQERKEAAAKKEEAARAAAEEAEKQAAIIKKQQEELDRQAEKLQAEKEALAAEKAEKERLEREAIEAEQEKKRQAAAEKARIKREAAEKAAAEAAEKARIAAAEKAARLAALNLQNAKEETIKAFEDSPSFDVLIDDIIAGQLRYVKWFD